MHFAISKKSDDVHVIRLGSTQEKALRLLAQRPEGLTEDALEKTMELPRSRPVDRMMHGLIKRGLVAWTAVSGITYTITPKGRNFLLLE